MKFQEEEHDCSGSNWCTPEYLAKQEKEYRLSADFGSKISQKIDKLLSKKYLKKVTISNFGEEFLDDIIFSEYYENVKFNTWFNLKSESVSESITEENFDIKLKEVYDIIDQDFDKIVLKEIKSYLAEVGYFDFEEEV